MRKLLAVGAGVALMFAVAGMAMAAEGQTVSVTGMLRGGYCFITMGAHGAKHKECAMTCAKKGIPVLLVTENHKMYTLLPPKRGHAIPSDVISHMEDKVTVTGREYTKDGQNFLTVQSLK